jgi:hypothetical protein
VTSARRVTGMNNKRDQYKSFNERPSLIVCAQLKYNIESLTNIRAAENTVYDEIIPMMDERIKMP